MIGLLVIALAVGPASTASPQAPLDVDGCVAIALQSSGQVAQAQGQVDEWEGRLKEVKANYAPTLFGVTYLAPMYGVHGDGFKHDYTVDLSEWGPYIHFESTLVKPIYTFGQIEAGEHAASERLDVEKARYEQTRNTVALEVRKFYYLYLYARSMKPTLNEVGKILKDANDQAEKWYESGNGKVTAVDLDKLRYATAELKQARIQQRVGEQLALAALKQAMGLPNDATLTLTDDTLPEEPDVGIPDIKVLLKLASEHRPEMAQIKHGEAAAQAAEQARRIANRPVLFLAGQFNFDWAPTRTHDINPWHYDPYNGVGGGAALGLRFDIDPWGNMARGDTAHGMVEQVEGLAKFAQTGIPLQIRAAHDTLEQAHEILDAATEGAMAAKKWMFFAGTEYTLGTGEARDVLEGVGAYVQAKKGYYDALLALHTARAQLRYVVGDVPVPYPPAPADQGE